jgi:hypothetical protein
MTADKGLTQEGKPRKRAPGAGRPPKHGEKTKPLRVPMSVSASQVSSIPELQAILDHWETECAKNQNSARHYFLRQALDEIRALGF